MKERCEGQHGSFSKEDDFYFTIITGRALGREEEVRLTSQGPGQVVGPGAGLQRTHLT